MAACERGSDGVDMGNASPDLRPLSLPPGTYPFTVTGTSGGVSATVSLTLIVSG
jgi:hypothetical protein